MDKGRHINDLLAAIDIVKLVSANVQLKKAGASYVASCPFHAEKTPSFHVFPADSRGPGRYKCFGCGASGDALAYIQESEGLDFPSAVRYASDLTGILSPEEARSQLDRARPRIERALRTLGLAILRSGGTYMEVACPRHRGSLTLSPRQNVWGFQCVHCGVQAPMGAFARTFDKEFPDMSNAIRDGLNGQDLDWSTPPDAVPVDAFQGWGGAHHANSPAHSVDLDAVPPLDATLREAHERRTAIVPVPTPGRALLSPAARQYLHGRKIDLNLAVRLGVQEDVARVRLVFPLVLHTGQAVSWTGRLYAPASPCPTCGTPSVAHVCSRCGLRLEKWYHAPGLPKDVCLYGENDILQGYPLVLVEGVTDRLNLRHHGIASPLGCLGTQVTFHQLALVVSWSRDIMVMGDGDKSGRDFNAHVHHVCSAWGARVEILRLPDGIDPGTLTGAEVTKYFHPRAFVH